MITDRPEASSTMSAAARAASVAPETANAAVRLFERGSVVHAVAVIPNNVAVLLEDFDNVVLISGNTWAKPSALSMDAADCADG